MPRAPRIQFEGVCYHVFHRGNRRERIFKDERDYFRFEEIMIEAMRWSDVRLYKWSLIPNHFHMLVETPDGNLAEFMSRLLTRYAKYFNWAHQFVGHVFQGRYGSILCDKDSYFRELVRYIALNPYRIKGSALARIGEWKWSSHRYLMMSESLWPDGLGQAFQDLLARFGRTPVLARQNYSKFLAEGLRNGGWESFYKVKGNRFLGEEPFVERAKQKIGESVRQSVRPIKRVRSAKELLDIVQAVSGIAMETLTGPSRRQTIQAWRQAMVFVGRKTFRLRVIDLASVLGRDATAASQILRRLEGRAQELKEIERLMEALTL